MTGDWHAADDLLAAYVRGDAGAVRGASLEQHLTRCAACRTRVAGHVETARLDRVWERVRESAQAPRPTLLERLLGRLGVSESDARLVAVAPSLRASWLYGIAATMAFVWLAAVYGGTDGVAAYLLLAPLVPVVGVAVAYGPDVDPSFEVAAAAPYPASRLLLLRTAAVLATSLPLVLGAGLVAPALSWTAVSWLLPALAFTAVTLAAATWVRPTSVAAVLVVGWIAAVGSAAVNQDPTAVLAPALLPAYAGLGAVALVVLRVRLRHLHLVGSLS
jgi:hypothetical protein